MIQMEKVLKIEFLICKIRVENETFLAQIQGWN